MPGTDPSILLQSQPFDLAKIYSEAMELRQMKQQFQTQNTLKMLAATPGMIDDKTGSWTPNALKQIMQLDPAAGQKAAADASMAQERVAQAEHTQSEAKKEELARHAEALHGLLDIRRAELGSGNVDPAIADRNLRSGMKDYLDALPISDEAKAANWNVLSQMPAEQLQQLAQKWSMSAEDKKEENSPSAWKTGTMPDGTPAEINTVTNEARPLAGGFKPEAELSLDERTRHDQTIENMRQKVAAGGADALTDEDTAFAAEMVLNGQPMPNMGYGAAGAAVRQKILHKAAQMAAEQSGSAAAGADQTIVRKESLAADKASLTSIAKQQTSVRQFSQTALGLADKIEQTMDKGTNKAGPEYLTKLMQNFKTGALGDPDTREFLGYITDLESENAKIMAGATGSVAQVSAHNQALMNQIIRGDMPASELKGALKTIRSGIELRNQSVADELARQKEQLKADTASGGKGGDHAGQIAHPANKAEYDTLPSGARYSKPGDPPGSYRTKK